MTLGRILVMCSIYALYLYTHGKVFGLSLQPIRHLISQIVSSLSWHAIQSFSTVHTLPKYWDIYHLTPLPSIYGHRLKKTRHPVRSAKVKLQIDLSVVGWVTTSESRLLYIFCVYALIFM